LLTGSKRENLEQQPPHLVAQIRQRQGTAKPYPGIPSLHDLWSGG
jgi:hypothetical protein